MEKLESCRPTCWNEQLFMQPSGSSQLGVKVRKEEMTPLAGSDKSPSSRRVRGVNESHTRATWWGESQGEMANTEVFICYFTEKNLKPPRVTAFIQTRRLAPFLLLLQTSGQSQPPEPSFHFWKTKCLGLAIWKVPSTSTFSASTASRLWFTKILY